MLDISSVVLIQYASVTDGQADRRTYGQTPHDSIYRAMHMRRAVKREKILQFTAGLITLCIPSVYPSELVSPRRTGLVSRPS